jgi:DNA-binding LacI/PurR family transcriptional regulator
MSTVIREGKGIPLARQVSLSLRQKIRAKEYPHGVPLPSLRVLKDEYGVTLNVMQRALRELESEGIVQAHHGKGVVVVDPDPARRTAITFGLIYPYSHMAFSQAVLYYAEQVFRNRYNLLVSVSSEDNSEREREVARHLVHNGVKALIVWPCADSSNGEFFNELSQTIPVVLADRLIEGAELPAVVLNVYDVGKDVATHFFQTLKRKRLLVVIDDLKISPYADFLRGLVDGARQLGREKDYTVMREPVSKIAQSLALKNLGELPLLQQATEQVYHALKEGGYDALFCYQSDLIDHGLIDSGLLSELPNLSLGTTGGETMILSRQYFKEEGALWLFDHPKMISTAADAIQQWILSKQPVRDIVALPVERISLVPRGQDEVTTAQLIEPQN